VEAARCHHDPKSAAEPSRAEPSRAEPSRAEPSRAEPSRAELSVDVVYIATCLVEGSVPDEAYIESTGLSSLLERALAAMDD
jgi:hypothetical protein